MARRGEARTLLGIGFACLLMMLAGLALVDGSGSMHFLACWALSVALIAVGIWPVLTDWSHERLDLFNLRNAFLGYYVLQFGVWSVWILATGETKFIGNLAGWEEPLTTALLYALVGLLAFQLGYGVKLGQSLARSFPGLPSHWVRLRTTVFVLAFLTLGVLSFLYIMAGWGGLGQFIQELAAARQEGIRGKGYFLLMAWFFPTVAVLLSYAQAVETCSTLSTLFSLSILLIGTSMGLALGYRAFVIFPVLQLLCLHHYLRQRIGLRLRYLLLLLPFLFLLNLYSYYRDFPLYRIRASEVVENLQSFGFWRESGMLFFRRFSGIETLMLVVDRFDTPEYGLKSIAYLLTFPIPRALWPEKISPASRFYETVFPDVSNPEGRNTTLPGELYWNFHIAGIVIGMFLVGIFCRLAYQYLLLHRNKPATLLYTVALVYIPWLIEAPTTHTAAYIAMMAVLVPTLIVLGVPGPSTVKPIQAAAMSH